MRTLLVPPPLRPGPLTIAGDEAHHGRSVLRLVPGDQVRLADGAGRQALAAVAGTGRHALEVVVAEVEEVPEGSAALITVATAVPKGDRFADLVRGLTELGVGAIRPLACARGGPLPRLERYARVAAEALKQSRRARLPELGPVVEIPTLATTGSRLIVLDQQGVPFQPGPPQAVTLVVGPEGGFTPDERQELAALGAVAIRLAGPVLRIETAALAAAAVWASAWEAYRQ